MDATKKSLDEGAAKRGGDHQNLRRMTLVLDVLAASTFGMKLNELSSQTRLSKTTLHRLMIGLAELGWVDVNEEDGSYLLGFRPLSLALAATDRYNLAQLAAPWLRQLAEATGDTVYLSLRSGDESLCVARYEGDFPVKTLTLSVGARRPLGVGAGSLALLAYLDDSAVTRLLERTHDARERYGIRDDTVWTLVQTSRERGYTLNDGMLVSGMSGMGTPVRTSSGYPVAAVSVAAISSRLTGDRQQGVAAQLVQCAKAIESELQAAVNLIERTAQ